MPIPVSYLSGASLSNTIGMFKRGTIAQNLKTSLESGYNWWSGIDIQATQYLIYSDTYTMGLSTYANSKPVMWKTDGTTDADVLTIINGLPNRVGLTRFTQIRRTMIEISCVSIILCGIIVFVGMLLERK